MDDEDQRETIDPNDLDQDTLDAVERATRGFQPMTLSKRYDKLTVYQQGQHDALSAVLAMLSRWQEEMDEECP